MLQPQTPPVDVVVLCRNQMPGVESTLHRLLHQRGCIPRLALFDGGSIDGSRRAAERHGVRIIDASEGRFSGGAVMNRAMRATSSPIVVFVQADAIPLSDDSVTLLVEAFAASPTLAAAFGRQVPRVAARGGMWSERGTAVTRWEGVPSSNDASFSMAASAVHRAAWCRQPFDERLRNAEDIEWISRVRRDGWTTECVAHALFERPQSATLHAQFARRGSETLLRAPRTGVVTTKRVPVTLGAPTALSVRGVRLRM